MRVGVHVFEASIGSIKNVRDVPMGGYDSKQTPCKKKASTKIENGNAAGNRPGQGERKKNNRRKEFDDVVSTE